MAGIADGRRKLHLELLRVIAIILVLFHHTEWRGFMLFLYCDGLKSDIYLFMSIACEIAVPIFFMISGALLLKKDDRIKNILLKRLPRFIFVLFAISAIYYIYDVLFNEKAWGGFMGILNAFMNNAASGALWYMYHYIALIMMLPFLRSIVKNATKQHYLYLIALNLFLVGILPMLSFFLTDGKYYFINTFNVVLATTMSFFFFLMGHFFENVLDEDFYNIKNCALLSAAALVAIIACVFLTQKWVPLRGFADSTSKGFHYTLVALPTFAIYAWAKFLFKNITVSKWVAATISQFGQCTFGIYLFERILREQTMFIFTWLDSYLPTMVSSCIWVVAIVIIGTSFMSILKLIPGVKKLI